jgi:hypothetical protein
MKLPGRHKLRITRAKTANYLLSPTHPSGRYKAAFFRRFGFSLAHADELAAALRSHGADCEVRKVENSPFGLRYILEGELATPDGRNPVVRSVWFIERGEDAPKLVTVYPVKRKRR